MIIRHARRLGVPPVVLSEVTHNPRGAAARITGRSGVGWASLGPGRVVGWASLGPERFVG